MKTLTFAICLFTAVISHANPTESSFRIFGEISTVDNQTYKGFISWGEDKNYWIDFFEASKTGNPYSHYFKKSDDLLFYNNGRVFATPPKHTFSCRFGDITSMRLTGPNEVSLTLKNGENRRLCKGNYSDINAQLKITTADTTIQLDWEQISQILFMAADQSNPPLLNRTIGVVKTKQGIYKGLITWNSGSKENAKTKEEVNLFLKNANKILRQSGILKIVTEAEDSSFSPLQKKRILYALESITVNMPNIGLVNIPFLQFEELEIVSNDQFPLLTYSDFGVPRPISGEIILQSGGNIKGEIAYDLDESLNIEILDGKNDNITYHIPFKYIRTIEPKNYKYSYLTLYNGVELSLGDLRDVTYENSGSIVFVNDAPPTYITWEEIKKIIINTIE